MQGIYKIFCDKANSIFVVLRRRSYQLNPSCIFIDFKFTLQLQVCYTHSFNNLIRYWSKISAIFNNSIYDNFLLRAFLMQNFYIIANSLIISLLIGCIYNDTLAVFILW